MLLIQDLIKKFKGESEEPEVDEAPKEIHDKYLESLRREREVQMNEVEKADLKKKIAEYKTTRMREHLFGIKNKREKEKHLLGQIRKVKVLQRNNNMLKQKSIIGNRSLLNNRKEEFRKSKKINIL